MSSGSGDAHNDGLKEEIAEAYFDDESSIEQLKDLVGHEKAANLRVLKMQLSEEFLEEAEEEFAES